MLIGMMMLFARSSVFLTSPDSLSIGITVDLLVTAPLVYYLLIRKTSIPKTTIVVFLIAGMVIGSYILPAQNQYYLDLFKTWVFPLVELSIVSFVIFKVFQAIKGYKTNHNRSFDFYTTLKNTCHEILPKSIVTPFVTEIAVFYYGFINWKKRTLQENEFSYHKESGTASLLFAILFIILIETVAVHILLVRWSELAAWILTILSLYTVIQLFGFLKSLSKRPISIENNKLFLRYGIMNETTIDLASIDSIEISSKDIELNEETRKLSFLGELEGHNVIIRLRKENTLVGLYGRKRKYMNLALHVDQKNEFKDRIDNALT